MYITTKLLGRYRRFNRSVPAILMVPDKLQLALRGGIQWGLAESAVTSIINSRVDSATGRESLTASNLSAKGIEFPARSYHHIWEPAE